jgi:hypothetical protein
VPNTIERVADEAFLDSVFRALMTTADTRVGGSDYHVMDYSQVLSIAATENTPLSIRLGRMEAARDIEHFWLEQSIPHVGAFTPLSEGSDPGLGSPVTPTRFSNVMMDFGVKFAITDVMNIIARAGGLHAVGRDEFGRQLAIKLRELIRDQEVAIIQGKFSSAEPRQMRGLLGDYKNAVEDGWVQTQGTSLDLSAGQVSSSNIATHLNTILRTVAELQAGDLPTTLYVGSKLLGVLAEAAKDKLQIVVNLSEMQNGTPKFVAGSAILKFYCDFGALDVVWHPLLTVAATGDLAAEKAKSRMLLLNESNIKLIDYVGAGGIHVEERAKTDATELRIIRERISLEVRQMKSMAQIHNFWV